MKRFFLFCVLYIGTHQGNAEQQSLSSREVAFYLPAATAYQTTKKYLRSNYKQILDDKLLSAIKDTGNVLGISYLLKAGANPNATDISGLSALRLAIIYGRADFVEQLLNAGANPNSTRGELRLRVVLPNTSLPLATALDYWHPIWQKKFSIWDEHAGYQKYITPSPTIIQMLVNHGANVNTLVSPDMSALTRAAHYFLQKHDHHYDYRFLPEEEQEELKSDSVNILKILLQAGATPDSKFLHLVNLYPDLKKVYTDYIEYYVKPRLQKVGEAMEAITPGSTAFGGQEQSGILDIISSYAYPTAPEEGEKAAHETVQQ